MVITKDFDLKKISYAKLGGKAKYLALPSCFSELKELVCDLRKQGSYYIVVGRGSNILFSDNGFDGYIISFKGIESGLEIIGDSARVFGNVSVADFVNKLYNKDLSGAEFLEGVPGCVLSSIAVNAGSRFGDFSNIVKYVKFLDNNGVLMHLNSSDIDFSYRNSIFFKDCILYEAGFSFIAKDNQDIKEQIEKNRLYRKRTQPIGALSLGCVFKNPEGSSAGALIEEAGLKDKSFGDICVSDIHANFFINKGNGTANDYYRLIRFVQEAVLKKFGVSLELEIKLVGNF